MSSKFDSISDLISILTNAITNKSLWPPLITTPAPKTVKHAFRGLAKTSKNESTSQAGTDTESDISPTTPEDTIKKDKRDTQRPKASLKESCFEKIIEPTAKRRCKDFKNDFATILGRNGLDENS